MIFSGVVERRFFGGVSRKSAFFAWCFGGDVVVFCVVDVVF